MKTLRSLALAAVLMIAMFVFQAVAGETHIASDNASAETAASVVLLSNKQVQHVQRVTALGHLNVVLVSNKNWVDERVGVPVLVILRPVATTITTLDGYSEVQITPKIITNNTYFKGLGHDHFARADV